MVAIYTAAAVAGRIDWALQSLTINGSPATEAQMDDFSVARLLGHPFWQEYINRIIYPRFSISAIDIGSDVVTVTCTRK